MRFPNLLASRNGRLAAFFFLYLTEGIPLGFTATAIATQMRRQGVGPAEIGAFVASLYLPWALSGRSGRSSTCCRPRSSAGAACGSCSRR
jgi:PAT family beta-lactamase induction signal transducer AmpG